MSGLLSVGYFLFSLITSLCIFVLWARFALRYFRVSALHPASQVVIGLTNPLLNPINTLFSLLKLKNGRYDWACLFLITCIELLKFTLIGPLFMSAMLSPALILLFTGASLIVEPCNLLFYAIILRIIMSWINPGFQHPMANLAYYITEPMLFQIRKRLPQTAWLDFSPLFAIVILKIVTLFITASMPLQLI
jgi:YggT family protein